MASFTKSNFRNGDIPIWQYQHIQSHLLLLNKGTYLVKKSLKIPKR